MASSAASGDGSERLHELEQKHLLLVREHEIEKAQAQAAKSALAVAQSTIAEIRDKLEAAVRQSGERELEVRAKDLLLKEKEQVTEDLKDQCVKRSEECDRLKDQLKLHSDELLAQQTRLRETFVELSDAQSRLLPLQMELHRAKRENELLEMSAKDLQQQIDARVGELRKYRDDSSSRSNQVETELRTAKEDSAALRTSQQSAQENIKTLNEKIDRYLKRIRDLETDVASMVSTHEHEMREKDKMVQLCKTHREEAHKRTEQLEQSLAAMKEANATQLTRIKSTMQAALDSATEKLASSDLQIQTLTQQLSVASTRIDSAQSLALSQSATRTTGSAASVEFEGASTTEMYNRVVVAERERDEANRKRTEAEIYLQRILKDVENKAPLIAAKQRDLNRVLESNSQLSKRLDEAVSQNQLLIEGIERTERLEQAAKEDAQVLEQANKDLSAQVQHLLQSSIEDDRRTSVALIESTGGGGEDLLTTFKDVNELQARNEQLLKFVRKLQLEGEKSMNLRQSVAKTDEDPSSSSDAIKSLMSEVRNLREARLATEQKVLGLIQQNEMYKIMLTESDAAVLKSSPPGITGPFTSSSSSSSETSPSRQQQDAVLRLVQSEEEKKILRERLSRAQEAENLLNESLEKIRQEAGALRLEKAQAVSEARYHSERASRIEESMKIAQTDSSSALQRRRDLEKTILDLQQECRSKDDKLLELQGKLREEQDSRRRAEIEVEVNLAALARVEKSLADERVEMKRQVTLAESVRNIENSLSTRTEEERLNLSVERDSLLRALEGVRKREADQALVDDKKFKSLEDDVRAANIKADKHVAELTAAKEEVLRTEGTARAAQERCSILEKQLTLTQERLEGVQGSQTMDTILQREAADREVSLERALAEVGSLKIQLLSEKSHSAQFQKISAATEATLKDLQRRSQDAKIAIEEENKSLRAELEVLSAELANSRQDSLRYIEELDEAKKELRESMRESAENFQSLNEEYAVAKRLADSALERENELRADIAKCQKETREARTTYLREMDIHVKEAKARDEMERELNIKTASLEKSMQACAELSANVVRLERLLADEKTKSENLTRELRDKFEELKLANDALHVQLRELSTCVTRSDEARSVDLSSSIARVSASAEGSEDAELRHSIDQMTLLLNSELKREKQDREMAEGKLSVAESENASQAQLLLATQRALDEARALMHRDLQENRKSSTIDTEVERLRSENVQLNIIRESNAHLRHENEDLAKTIASLRSSLVTANASASPLEASIRRLNAENEALKASNAQVETERGFWKDKVTNILSRYNDVDPDEHKALKDKVTTLLQDVADYKASSAALTTETEKLKADFSAKEKVQQAEVASAKNLVQGLEKTADNFRNKMRKVLEEKAQAQEAVKVLEVAKLDLAKQVQELNEKLVQNQSTAPVLMQSQPATLTAQQQQKQQRAKAQPPQKQVAAQAEVQSQVQTKATAAQPVPVSNDPKEAAASTADASVPTLPMKRRREAASTQGGAPASIEKDAEREVAAPASATIVAPGRGGAKKRTALPPVTEAPAPSTQEPAEQDTAMDVSADKTEPEPKENLAESTSVVPAVAAALSAAVTAAESASLESASVIDAPDSRQITEPEKPSVEVVTVNIESSKSDNLTASKLGNDEEEEGEIKPAEVVKVAAAPLPAVKAAVKVPQVSALSLLKAKLLKEMAKVAPLTTTTTAAEAPKGAEKTFVFGLPSLLSKPGQKPTTGFSSTSSSAAQQLSAAANPFAPAGLGNSKSTTATVFGLSSVAGGAAQTEDTIALPGRGKAKTVAPVPAPAQAPASIFGGQGMSAGFGGFLLGKPATPLFSTMPANSLLSNLSSSSSSSSISEVAAETTHVESTENELEQTAGATTETDPAATTETDHSLTAKIQMRAARFGTKPAASVGESAPTSSTAANPNKKRPAIGKQVGAPAAKVANIEVPPTKEEGEEESSAEPVAVAFEEEKEEEKE